MGAPALEGECGLWPGQHKPGLLSLIRAVSSPQPARAPAGRTPRRRPRPGGPGGPGSRRERAAPRLRILAVC